MTVQADPHTLPSRSAEASSLARELARAHGEMIRHLSERTGLSREDAIADVARGATNGDVERVKSLDPEQLSWIDLDSLAIGSPEVAEDAWNGALEAATDELQAGFRTSRSCESVCHSPFERARFLALRAELARTWEPQLGMEWTLIDQLALAQTQLLFWQTRLVSYSMLESNQLTPMKDGWTPARVTEHQAVEQAGAMVDRFHRIFQRTLRSLRDLRRHAPQLVVQNAVQVNFADQELNVAD